VLCAEFLESEFGVAVQINIGAAMQRLREHGLVVARPGGEVRNGQALVCLSNQ